MTIYKPKAYSKAFHTRFLVRHKLVERYKREKGIQNRTTWYTASHLNHVFSRATLREKIMAFSPSILARPESKDEPSEFHPLMLFTGSELTG